MAKSEIRKLLDPLLKATGARNVFNDAMDNGGRSIKVWGWKEPQYDLAQKLLEENGYTVKRIKTYQSGGSIRLHVF